MKLFSKAGLFAVCAVLAFSSCEEELHHTDRAEDAHIYADEECFVKGVANVMFSEDYVLQPSQLSSKFFILQN